MLMLMPVAFYMAWPNECLVPACEKSQNSPLGLSFTFSRHSKIECNTESDVDIMCDNLDKRVLRGLLNIFLA